MTLAVVGIAGLVLVISFLMTLYLCSPNSWFYRLDHPNERSLHSIITPRTGGLAIVASLLIGLAAFFVLGWACGTRCGAGVLGNKLLWIVAMALLVGSISFLDDMIGLSAGLRFVVHIFAAVGIVAGAGLVIDTIAVPTTGLARLGWVGFPFTVLFLIWMTNLYNFMDGMDGFAGGMSVVGFGFMAIAAWAAGGYGIATLSLLIAAASSGFLFLNVPPARVFMGDVGSTTLGFLAGALAVLGVADKLFDIWVPVLIFSPFGVDATVTLLRRLTRGQRVWRPHREHYYQRLVLAGWGHQKTVLSEYVLMIAAGLSALIYARAGAQARLGILIAWSCLYFLIACGIQRIIGHRRRFDDTAAATPEVNRHNSIQT